MDKQLEERIRERAYELWMQNGSLPGRAEEYWLQAEQEVLGTTDAQSSEDVGGGTARDVGSYSVTEGGQETEQDESQNTVDVSPAPLGMTSETTDEAQATPTATKTRKRRSSASPASGGEGEAAPAAPKRRRSTRTS